MKEGIIPRAQIDAVASALPPKIVTSLELERNIREQSPDIRLPTNVILTLTGVNQRRVLDGNQQASDLAAQAAEKALSKAGMLREDIECIIFAAASRDVLEPATANIVQEKLRMDCPVLDVGNACNSFLNGMEVAEAFIASGKYSHVLVANGEVPSRVVRTKVKDFDQLRKSFAGYTLGDAGAAMILGPSDGKRGLLHSSFTSYGDHWRLCTVLGGGTLSPRDPETFYFEGETSGLKDVFLRIGSDQLTQALKKTGWNIGDVKKIITHQVSMETFGLFVDRLSLPREKMVVILPEYGNLVSASIPVALDLAEQNGEISKGDNILLLGLAAGISVSTMTLKR